MSSQDGPGAFLFAFQRPTARLSLPIPSSWRRPCNQRNPGLALSWWHSHMHVFETSHRRVFRWELCKRSLSIPTIFDSLMTRRGLGGCDPERDRGDEEGRGGHHILGRADSCLLLPLPRFPHCLPEGCLICRLASSRPSPTPCPRGESEMVVGSASGDVSRSISEDGLPFYSWRRVSLWRARHTSQGRIHGGGSDVAQSSFWGVCLWTTPSMIPEGSILFAGSGRETPRLWAGQWVEPPVMRFSHRCISLALSRRICCVVGPPSRTSQVFPCSIEPEGSACATLEGIIKLQR